MTIVRSFTGFPRRPSPSTLPEQFRDILIHANIIKKAGAKITDESLMVGLRLVQTLVSLPNGIINREDKEHLDTILRFPDRFPTEQEKILEITHSLFPAPPLFDCYSPLPQERKLIAAGTRGGAERYLTASPPPRPFVRYQFTDVEKSMTPLPADPPWMTITGYRLAEISSLTHLLRHGSPARLIFVPGFVGTGKKSYVVPGITGGLQSQPRRGSKFIYIDIRNPHTGLKALKAELNSAGTPPILILDEVYVLDPQDETKIKNLLKTYLQKRNGEGKRSRKVVLIGGGPQSTESQKSFLEETFNDLVEENERAVVPVEVKPLNFLQAEEILTGKQLNLLFSAKERKLFVQFARALLPSYLIPLREFSLPSHVMSLADALRKFEKTVTSGGLISALRYARISPQKPSELERVIKKISVLTNDYLQKYAH